MKKLLWLLIFSLLGALSGCASVPRPNLPAHILAKLASDPSSATASATANNAQGASASGATAASPVSIHSGVVRIPKPPPYEAWNRVLQKFVDEQGRVDFAALAQDRADLDQFVSYIYDIGPNNQPQWFPTAADVLAYHINAYNALAMYKVLDSGIPDTLAGVKKISFFVFGKVQVGGQPISLYDYENQVIRPLGEARVHMALNCMSVSCPRLPKTAFVGALLEQQLQQETEYFLSEARNVSVDGQRLLLSEIFKLYTGDFLRDAPSLPAWIKRYRKAPLPDQLAIEFTPYNWAINRQP